MASLRAFELGTELAGASRFEDQGLSGDVVRLATLLGASVSRLEAWVTDERFADEWSHLQLLEPLGIEFDPPKTPTAGVSPGCGLLYLEEWGARRCTATRSDEDSIWVIVAPGTRETALVASWEGKQWRHPADWSEARKRLRPSGNPLDLVARKSLGQRARKNSWPPALVAEMLGVVAAARSSGEWITPLEVRLERAAWAVAIAELAIVDGREPDEVAADLRAAGLGT